MFGTCHLCGEEGKLTYEHIPPEKAYNDQRIVTYPALDSITRDEYEPWDFENLKGKQLQRGLGLYSLCESCNNKTGSWYGSAYIDFVKQGYSILNTIPIKNTSTLNVQYKNIYPLRIIKQIISLFVSLNNEGFLHSHNGVKEFLLDKDKQENFQMRYGIHIHLTKSLFSRFAGVFGLLHQGGVTTVASELVYPPYGYVWDLKPNGLMNDIDIMDWTYKYSYNESINLDAILNVKECNTAMPMDYRTKNKVREDIKKNKAYKENTKNE